MSRPRETHTDPDIVGIVDPFDSDLPKKPNWVNLAQLETPIDDALVNNLLYKVSIRRCYCKTSYLQLFKAGDTRFCNNTYDSDLPKKPNWVNLAQLETPVDDALVNNLLYKPALRYHGITSGLWGLGLSRTPSIATDSKPPSYKFNDPLNSKHDTFSTSDQGSLYRTKNLSAVSPVTLRRRNTIAVILVAIGLLAAVATITGIILHVMHPNALLRGHVRFTIANENFTDNMRNKSSEEFQKISRTLCSEMDYYYLTSELSDFYLGCRLIALSNDTTKPGLAVHYTIDFKDNPLTNDKDRIKNVILRKSGRQASDANLYFVIRDYLVYLRSLRVELEKVPIPSGTPNYIRPIIPWRDDLDFIARKSVERISDQTSTKELTDANNVSALAVGEDSVKKSAVKLVLPSAKDVFLQRLNRTALFVPNNKTNHANIRVHVPVLTNNTKVKQFANQFINDRPVDMMLADLGPVGQMSLDLNPTPVLMDKTNVHIDLHDAGNDINIQPPIRGIDSIDTSTLNVNMDEIFKLSELPEFKADVSKTFEHVTEHSSKHDLNLHHLYKNHHQHGNLHHHEGLNDNNHHHRHVLTMKGTNKGSEVNNLKSSFNQPNQDFYKMVETTPYILVEENESTTNSKIMSITNNVYLIMGQSSKNYMEKAKTRPTRSIQLFPSGPTAETVSESSVIQEHGRITSPIVSIVTNSDVIVTTVATKEIQPSPIFVNEIKQTLKPTIVRQSSGDTSVDRRVPDFSAVMNELVVQRPHRIRIPPKENGVRWINIFNIPRRRVAINVDELFRNREIERRRVTSEINHIFNSFNTSTTDAVTFAIRDLLPDFKQTMNGFTSNSNNDMSFQSMQGPHQRHSFDDIFKLSSHQMQSETHTHDHSDNHHGSTHHHSTLPKVKVRTHEHMHSNNEKKANFREFKDLNDFDENINVFAQTVDTEITFPPFGRIEDQHPNFREHIEQEISNDEDGHETDKQGNGHLRNIFDIHSRTGADTGEEENDNTAPSPISTMEGNTNNQWFDRRQTDMAVNDIGRTITHPNIQFLSQFRSPVNLGESNRNNQFPFNLQRQSFPSDQTHFSGNTRNAFLRRQFGRQGLNRRISFNRLFTRNRVRMNPRSFTAHLQHLNENDVLSENEDQSQDDIENIANEWLPFHEHSERQGNLRNQFNMNVPPVGINRRISPAMHSFGIPISSDFNDIEDIKNILKDVIESFYNMTKKLDHMQNAIDFINDKLHEERRPIFRLEDTLENMTLSLDNLKTNLNNMNTTLKRFKKYLEQFDNTVFDVHDVLKYLDETLDNINKTVSYVGSSLKEMSDTVGYVDDVYIRDNSSLIHLNNSVKDVKETNTFANRTLDSMNRTLDSLEKAVTGLNSMVDDVLEGMIGMNVSLNNINETVKDSHRKMGQLKDKMKVMNISVDSIESTVQRLNRTYSDINEALIQLNNSFIFINGTTKDAIRQLQYTDERLSNISHNMDRMRVGISSMNVSLQETIDWMATMVQNLNKLNATLDRQNNSIIVNLQNAGILETLATLLDMNYTLSDFGKNVDLINKKLNEMESNLVGLETNLDELHDILSNMNVTFRQINSSIATSNSTIKLIEKSLGLMNGSFEVINTTLNNLSNASSNIKKTLDEVNTTLTLVQDRNDQVKDQSKEINSTFERINEKVDNVIEKFHEIYLKSNYSNGSLLDLDNHLQKTNKSIHRTKNEADDIKDAFDMLINTLLGMEATAASLQIQVNGTDDPLNRVNKTFNEIDISIKNMAETKTDWNDRLNKLKLSFKNINDSMKDIGHAFPNMATNLNDLHRSIAQLENKITNQSLAIKNQNDTKENEFKRFTRLISNKQDIKNALNDTILLIETIKGFSREIKIKLNEMDKKAENVSALYNNMERNFELLNNSLSPMQNRFNKLQYDASVKYSHFKNLSKTFKNHIEELKALKNSSANFKNLNIPFADMEHSLLSELSKISENLVSLETIKDNLTEASKLVWNELYQPIDINKPHLHLRKSLEVVISVIDGANDTLAERSDDMRDLISSSNDTDIKLRKIGTTIQKMRDLLGRSITIKTKEQDLEDDIKQKENSSMAGIEQLRFLKDKLNKIKSEYGNINGTYNSTTDDYDNIEKMLTDIDGNLKAFNKSLADSRTNFETLKEGARANMSSYHNLSLDEGLTSHEKLKRFISNMNTYYDNLNSTKYDIEEMSLEEPTMLLKHVETMLIELESKLQDKSNKHNLVNKLEPIFKDRLMSVVNEMMDSNSSTNNLQGEVLRLVQYANQLSNRSKLLPHMDINFKNEYLILKVVDHNIDMLDGNISSLNDDIKRTQLKFENLKRSNLSYDDAKDAIKDLNEDMESIDKMSATISKDTKQVEKDLSILSNVLQGIEKLLDMYNETLVQTESIGNDIEKLSKKSTKSRNVLDDVQSAFDEIETVFQTMQSNYTNFTETNVNLKDPVLVDTLTDIRNSISNVSAFFENVDNISNVLNRNFNDVQELFNGTSFNRSNTENIIFRYIAKKNQQMSDDINLINKSLDDFNDEIKLISTQIQDLNEMMQMKNDKLLIDKRKKMLVDYNLPKLEEERIRIEKIIMNLNPSLFNLSENVNDTIQDYDFVHKRLLKKPNTNISMDSLYREIGNISNKMKAIQGNIDENSNYLSEIDSLLMKDQGGYSFNDTIDDIKSRFQEAEANMNLIIQAVEKVKNEIEKTSNDNDIVNNKITLLNDSLNYNDKVNSSWFGFKNEFEDLSKRADDGKTDLQGLKIMLENITDDINGLSKRFNLQNMSIFTDLVQRLNDSLQKSNESHNDLVKLTQPLNDNINAIEQKLLKAFEHKLDENNIDNINKLLKRELKEARHIMNETHILLDIFSNDTDVLTERIVALKDEVINAKEILLSEEKKELYMSISPEDKFEDANITIIKLVNAVETLETNISNAFKLLQEVSSNFESLDNFNISFKKSSNTLQLANESVSQNKERLEDIFNNLKSLEHLLLTTDGRPYSERESIGEMKERFGKLQNGLNEINNVSRDISDKVNILKTEELPHVIDILDHSKSLWKDYSNISDEFKHFTNSFSSLNDKFQSSQDENNIRVIKLQKMTDALLDLKKGFNISNNTEPHSLMKLVENGLDFGNELSSNITGILTDIKRTNDTINDIMNKQSNTPNQEFSSLKGLDTFISKYPNTRDQLQSNLNLVKNKIHLVSENSELFDKNLNSTRDMLNNLRKTLNRNKKEAYVHNMSSKTAAMIRNITLGIERTSMTSNEIEEKLNQTFTNIEALNDTLSNVRSVNIDLSSEENAILSKNKTLTATQTELQSITSQLKELMEINNAIINNPASIYNKSFDDIKHMFDDITNNVNDLSFRNRNISEILSNTSNVIKDTDNKISLLENALLRRATLLSRTDDMKNKSQKILLRQEDVQKDSRTSKGLITNIKNVIDKINTTYDRDNDPSLWKEFELLGDEFEKQIQNYEDLQNDQNDVNQTLNESYSILQRMERIINKQISNISQLEKYNEDISTLLEQSYLLQSNISRTLGQNIANQSRLNDKLYNTKMSVDDIEKDLKYQQIKRFMKSQFPKVLDRFNFVNETLGNTTLRLNTAANLTNKLNKHINETESLLRMHPYINIPLDYQINTSMSISNTISDSLKQKEGITTELHKFSDIISNRIDSNDTIEMIEDRLTDYVNNLETILASLDQVNKSIDLVMSDTTKTIDSLGEIDENVQKYDMLIEKRTLLQNNLTQFEDEITKKHIKHNTQKDDLEIMEKSLKKLKRRFSNINDTDLTLQLKNAGDDLKNIDAKMNETYLKSIGLRNISVQNSLKLNDSQRLTEQTTDKLNILAANIKEMDNLLTDVENDLNNKTDIGLHLLEQSIRNNSALLNTTMSDIDILRQMFLEKEKELYLRYTLPELLESHKQLHDRLTTVVEDVEGTKKEITAINDSLDTLSSRISDNPNIDFNISNLNDDLQAIRYDNYNNLASMKQQREVFYKIDGRVFTETYWKDNSTKEIHFALDKIDAKLNDINQNASDVNKTDTDIKFDMQDIKTNISNIEKLIDLFEQINSTNEDQRTLLKISNDALNSTRNRLSRLSLFFKKQRQYLLTLNESTNGKKSETVSKLVSDIETILLDKVGLRLPLLENVFQTRILQKLKRAGELHDLNTDTLNTVYQSPDTLAETLNGTLENLETITRKVNAMNTSNVSFNQEINKLNENLNETEILLNSLENVIESEKKRRLLEKEMPTLTEVYTRIKDDVENITQFIPELEESMNETGLHSNNVIRSLKEFENINISHKVMENSIRENLSSLKHIRNDIPKLSNSLRSLAPNNLNRSALIGNNSVTVLDLQTMLNKLHDDMNELENKTSSALDVLMEINSTNADHNDEIKILQDTFRKYKELHKSQDAVKIDMNTADHYVVNVSDKLNTIKNNLSTLNETMYDLFKSYNISNPNDEKVVELLLEADKKIKNLGKKLNEANDFKSDVNKTLKEIELLLNRNINDTIKMNETVSEGEIMIPDAEKKIMTLNQILTNIMNEIPTVSASVEAFETGIEKVNYTLRNELQKHRYISIEQPKLQAKYKSINATFDMTNKSLDMMLDNIRLLEENIRRVKQDMDTHATIDIDMAPLVANVSHMENRLAIMKGHYKNIEEVVEMLKTDLKKYKQPIENMTLNETIARFQDFNTSLGNADNVLRKIDTELADMDDHVMFLNDTVFVIDDALKTFDKGKDKIDEKQKEISSIEVSVNKTKSDLKDLSASLTYLNDSFANMLSIYKDVIDTTAENNTQFANDMNKLRIQMDSFRESADKLFLDLELAKDNYGKMNESLFTNVDTYNGLNKTLSDFMVQYKNLTDAIKTLSNNALVVGETSSGLNSSLLNLGEVLKVLNKTLDDEQTKFNFLSSNLGGLHSRSKSLGNRIKDTDSSIGTAEALLHQANSSLVAIDNLIERDTRLDIPLENEIIALSNSTETIVDIKNKYQKASQKFNELINNLTSAQDRSGKISDIKQKYKNINSTLDSLSDNLDAITRMLNDTSEKTKAVEDTSKDLFASVKMFENVTSNVAESASKLDKVGSRLNRTKSVMGDNENSIEVLENQTRTMSNDYSEIDDKGLMNNLTSLIENITMEKSKLSKLNERYLKITDKQLNASETIKATQQLLNGTFNSKDQLYRMTKYSTDKLRLLENIPTELNLENSNLDSELLLTQLRITNLENQLNDLNDTLFEEKMKINFVKNNFPSAETRYKMLEHNLKESVGDIQNKSKGFKEVKHKLDKLETVIGNLSSIDIPLNLEKRKAQEIEREINALQNIHNNLTERHNTLNITQLQDRSKSFNNLKGDYDSFNNVTQTLDNDLNNLNDRLTTLGKMLSDMNITTTNFSSILETYNDTKINALGLYNDIHHFKDSFSNISNQVLEMENKLKQLNETLMNLANDHIDIKDPILLKTKESLEKMIKEAYDGLSKLKNTTEHLHRLHTKTNENERELNTTISRKKVSVKDLQTDIANANLLFNNISSLLDSLNVSQIDASNSAGTLQPDIKSIADILDRLNKSFETEQIKQDFIKQERPILEKSFRNLKGPLAETNKELSDIEMKLSDLKIDIDTVGSRLNRFKPIHITTLKEDNLWQNLTKQIQSKSQDFIGLNNIYSKLKDDILQLSKRNDSIDDLKIHYNKINDTIDTIDKGLVAIKNNVLNVSQESAGIDAMLNQFRKIMDDFKSVQVRSKSLKTDVDSQAKDNADQKRKSDNVAQKLSSVKDIMLEMERKFRKLSDPTWKRKLPEMKKKIGKMESTVSTTNSTIQSLAKSINEGRQIVDTALDKLQKSGLERTNASEVIETVNTTVSTTQKTLDNVKQRKANVDKKLSSLTKDTDLTKKELEMLNRTLSKELQKLTFVNITLPDLRAKHTRVNASFVANVPDVKILQTQIEDVVSVISKIKEKMRVFGLQDTDKTIHNWDQSLDKLNKTVVDIIKRNKQTKAKLIDLKKKLWRDGPMYTKKESLKVVKARFNVYNRTLNEIMAAVHKIEVKLIELDKTSQDLTATLLDHDEMLTTTPEPLGPPIWLELTSTTVGTIGKDPGYVECSVGDLTDWEIMKITRQRSGGKEQTVAAWKLGVGARKTIRDRRISVKKSENATGGSLRINIRSLQCEDEAAYYCSIDTYRKYPLRTDIAVVTPPEDSLDPEFPTEVFEDKIANFSCTGHPGYPSGRLIWKIKHENEKDFKNYKFYSAKTQVSDTDCIRTEVNRVEHQFDMSWNNTKIRCYIENTEFYGEGIIRLLPYDICNKVRFLGTIRHPYTPHKFIVCGKELNIMQCPGNTCYDRKEENCVQCAANIQSADPCHGKPLFSYVAHERDCKKYYICMGPTKTVKKCTKGYFNPNRPGNCVMSYPESYCAQRSG